MKDHLYLVSHQLTTYGCLNSIIKRIMLVRESFPSVPLQAARWGGLVGAVACGERAANIPGRAVEAEETRASFDALVLSCGSSLIWSR